MVQYALFAPACLAAMALVHPHGQIIRHGANPSLWAQSAKIAGDVTGDGVGEVVCAGAVIRRSAALGLDLAPEWDIHNGANGTLSGRIQGLPFTYRSCTPPALIQFGGRPWLASFGLNPTPSPSIGVALISTQTLCIENVLQSSQPSLDTGQGALGRIVLRYALGQKRDDVVVLLLASDPVGRSCAKLLRIRDESAALWTDVWSDRLDARARPASVAATPDIDGDGEGDFVVGWVPNDPVEGADHLSVGRLEFLCGRAGKTIRTVTAPKDSGLYGRSIAACPSTQEIFVGAPGAVWLVDNREVVRHGAVHVYSIPTLELARTIARPQAELSRYSSGVAVADRFGEDLLLVACGEQRTLVVGDPAASLSGEVYGFDAEGTAEVWRVQGGPDGRFDMQSDFEFGGRLSGDFSSRVLVNARRPHNGGGRVLILDGCTGDAMNVLVAQ